VTMQIGLIVLSYLVRSSYQPFSPYLHASRHGNESSW